MIFLRYCYLKYFVDSCLISRSKSFTSSGTFYSQSVTQSGNFRISSRRLSVLVFRAMRRDDDDDVTDAVAPLTVDEATCAAVPDPPADRPADAAPPALAEGFDLGLISPASMDIGHCFDIQHGVWRQHPVDVYKATAAKRSLVAHHFQPSQMFEFPSHKGSDGRNRKFRLEWLDRNPWLVKSRHCDDGFCLPCLLFPATATRSSYQRHKFVTTL